MLVLLFLAVVWLMPIVYYASDGLTASLSYEHWLHTPLLRLDSAAATHHCSHKQSQSDYRIPILRLYDCRRVPSRRGCNSWRLRDYKNLLNPTTIARMKASTK